MVQLPRYRQMADQIKQAVREGVLPPDSRLPSVRVLAAQYNVSLTTALKVLRTLEDEHVAVARRNPAFCRPGSACRCGKPQYRDTHRRFCPAG